MFNARTLGFGGFFFKTAENGVSVFKIFVEMNVSYSFYSILKTRNCSRLEF